MRIQDIPSLPHTNIFTNTMMYTIVRYYIIDGHSYSRIIVYPTSQSVCQTHLCLFTPI